MNIPTQSIIAFLVSAFLIGFSLSTNVWASPLASRANNAASCEAEGYLAGQNRTFSQELYEACQNIGANIEYRFGFVLGCTDAANSRGVCEYIADAGIREEGNNSDDNGNGNGNGDGDGDSNSNGDGDGDGNDNDNDNGDDDNDNGGETGEESDADASEDQQGGGN